MATASSAPDLILKQALRDLITGSHILHYQKVLDAYGHLSLRHPHEPSYFLLSRSIAPALIASPSDIITYHISDASPIDPTSTAKGYVERYIHSEIYKRYPSVQAIVHSHCPDLIPYGISGVPLRACCHMAGFLGTGTPVWDISKCWREGEKKDFLVRNTRLGASLVECFGEGPAHAAVLMRGHGVTVVAGSLVEVVGRAVYAKVNAGVMTTAFVTRLGYFGIDGQSVDQNGIAYLDEDEAERAAELMKVSSDRAWALWVREVETAGLFLMVLCK